ncbi:unnamed protein product, partial [Cladocopium goreaui]
AGPDDVPDWKLRNARVAKERCEKLKEKHPEVLESGSMKRILGISKAMELGDGNVTREWNIDVAAHNEGPPAADFQLPTINRVENVSSADAASLDCFLISESLRTLFLKTGLLFAKCESLSLGHRHHLPSCLLPQKEGFENPDHHEFLLSAPLPVGRVGGPSGHVTVEGLSADEIAAFEACGMTHITGSCFVGHQLPYPRLPWYRNDIELVLCNPNHCLRHRDSLLEALARAKEYDKANFPIFFHCNSGMHRAPTLALAFLARVKGMREAEAAELIKSRRSMVQFMAQPGKARLMLKSLVQHSLGVPMPQQCPERPEPVGPQPVSGDRVLLFRQKWASLVLEGHWPNMI